MNGEAAAQVSLTREWLDSQAAAGLVSYVAVDDSYMLSDEAAMILADDASPAFMARGMNALVAMVIDGDKLKAAFQGDGGLGWREHHQCLFKGTEWFFRPGYRAFLTESWIPALDGVEDKLRTGAKIADIFRSCAGAFAAPGRYSEPRSSGTPRIRTSGREPAAGGFNPAQVESPDVLNSCSLTS